MDNEPVQVIQKESKVVNALITLRNVERISGSLIYQLSVGISQSDAEEKGSPEAL